MNTHTVSLKKLLEEPFGPYPDHYILNPHWARSGSFRPTLTSVQMRCAGDDIGLDETELLDEALPTSRTVQHDVEVTGVLEIEKLDWLSEQGRSWLNYDLRKRDDQKSMSTKASRLTLEAVYGDGIISGSTISVWVNLVKVLSAVYKTLDDDPESLILFSKDNRSFRIASLDVKTFDLSREFLERYTIRRLIQQLILGSDTPINERNIEWLVEQYFEQIIPLDKYIRYIYNPKMTNITTNSRGALKLSTPRYSRPVHKAEIRKIFAKHSEWILADQIAVRRSPNARYLDIRQWYEFIKEYRIAVGSSTNEREPDIVGSLTRFGGKRESWQRRLEIALKTPLHRRKLEQEHVLQRTAPTPSIKQPIHQRPSSSHDDMVPDIEFQYDSDFSEASTPSTSTSDSESEAVDPKMLEKVPWYCRVPPRLEVSQFVWQCPGCRVYQIDLLDVDEDELEKIPAPYAQILRTRNWQKITDSEVLTAFGHLVSNHYEEHLKRLGLQLVTKDGKVIRSVLIYFLHTYQYDLNLGDLAKMAPGVFEGAAKISKTE